MVSPTMADVVKITILVTDITAARKSLAGAPRSVRGNFPANWLLQVAALAEPSVEVEIDAIAVLAQGNVDSPGVGAARAGPFADSPGIHLRGRIGDGLSANLPLQD